jgi:hypothetical protein
MFTLDVGVRAVVFTAGKLLLQRADSDQPAWECIEAVFIMGTTLPSMIERALAAKLSLTVSATKLLYIVERFFARDSTNVHQITHYYLCDPQEAGGESLENKLAAVAAGVTEFRLLRPDGLGEGMLSPACLREVLIADAAEQFNVSPKLLVDNQLGDKSTATSGVYRA